MLAAVKGIIQRNTVVMEEDMQEYEGAEVKKKLKPSIDWDSFALPGERGKDVEGYMREIRENDRDNVYSCG